MCVCVGGVWVCVCVWVYHYSKFLPTRRICSVKTFGIMLLGLPADKSSC